MPLNVGVLGFQGDFAKHLQTFAALGVRTLLVRRPEEVERIDALVIPGGESTTIGKLMDWFGLLDPVRERARAGMPVFGTCAGAILLATEIVVGRSKIGAERVSDQQRLGVIDMTIARNAYGRQIESFEAGVRVPELGNDPVQGVFIRAPIITRTGSEVEVLAEYEGTPVIVRHGRHLAATFHPELTGDPRIHSLFVSMISTTEATRPASQ